MTAPESRLAATVLGAPDPRRLGEFYARLLGWRVVETSPGWERVKPESGDVGLSFQLEENHVTPVWPAPAGGQQMQMHLDIAVDDLEEGVARAVRLGARLADFQPQDTVRVMIDPAGPIIDLFRSGT